MQIPPVDNRPQPIKTKRNAKKVSTIQAYNAKEESAYYAARERRSLSDRRQRNEPVKLDRRRGERRLDHQNLSPELRQMLSHSGDDQAQAMTKRKGKFFDKSV